jgi:tetratricopeptide (TPR) repeat protein
MNNLGNVYLGMKQYAKARALYERALASQDPATADRNPHVAVFLNNLASVHEATGEPKAAEALFVRAITGFETALGPDHSFVAVGLWGLAHLQLGEGRPREALPSLERAAAIVDANPGVQQNEFNIHFDLARALVGAHGDRARALAAARKALDGFRSPGADQAEEVATVQAWLTRHDLAAGSPRRSPDD